MARALRPGRPRHPEQLESQPSAGTGDQAAIIREGRLRLEAVASLLAAVAIGHAAPGDVIPGALRLVDQAARMIDQASDHRRDQ